jgi:sialidase-1
MSSDASVQAPTQTVEGFDEIISSESSPRIIDARGLVQAFSSELYWKVGFQQALSWFTAQCTHSARTTFAFMGSSSNRPCGLPHGSEAALVLNGERAIVFELGLRRPVTWRAADVELAFTPLRTQTPFEGYHRFFEANGNSGLYRLTVPASLVRDGRQRVEVKLHDQAADHPAWFMVVGRSDTLSLTVDTLNDEVRTLQSDLARLKDTVNTLSETVYADHYSERARTQHTVVYTSRRHSVLPQDMARLANGDLVVSFREGPEHTVGFSPEINGRITMVRSTDEARSWSGPTIVYEREKEDNLDPTITQLAGGTVLLHWIHSDRYDSSGMMNPPEGRRFYVKTLRSDDFAYTWESEPSVLDPGAASGGGCACSTEKIVELPGGELLMPVYFNYGDRDAVAAVYDSTDGGRVWDHRATVMDGRDPATLLEKGPTEPALVHTGSGRLVMLMRTDPPDGHFWQSISEDGGHTWRPPWRTDIYAHNPPNFLRLRDGRLLLSYGYRRRTDPGGIRAVVSEDDGETWGAPIVLRQDFPNWDNGYASSVEMAGTTIFTTYYYQMFSRYYVGGTFWELPG